MDRNELTHYIKLSSIPLRKLDRNRMPIRFAAGCLIDFKKKRLLLTVQHATGDMGNWAVEVRYEPSKGTRLFPLNAMTFLASTSINNPKFQDIDFSYVSVPKNFVSYFQVIKPNGQIVLEEKRKVCLAEFDEEPKRTESYGFSGYVMPTRISNALIMVHKIYLDLKYIGIEDDYYIFKLPMRYPGHEHFQGCSGAPIIDTRGKAVALVCKGDIDKNQIYGISLKKYKIALEVTYGELANGT